jgi:hypothetical protein
VACGLRHVVRHTHVLSALCLVNVTVPGRAPTTPTRRRPETALADISAVADSIAQEYKTLSTRYKRALEAAAVS